MRGEEAPELAAPAWEGAQAGQASADAGLSLARSSAPVPCQVPDSPRHLRWVVEPPTPYFLVLPGQCLVVDVTGYLTKRKGDNPFPIPTASDPQRQGAFVSLDTTGDCIGTLSGSLSRSDVSPLFPGSGPSVAGRLLRLAQASSAALWKACAHPARRCCSLSRPSGAGDRLQLRAGPLTGGRHLTEESWARGKRRRQSLPMVLSPLGTPIQASPTQET